MATVDFIILNDKNKILCQKRPKGKDAYFLKLPGGKCKEGESHGDCIKRELKRQLNLDLSQVYGLVYSNENRKIDGKLCRYDMYFISTSGLEKIKASNVNTYTWVSEHDIETAKFKWGSDEEVYLGFKIFFKNFLCKKLKIEYFFLEIMNTLGVPITDSTKDTPGRVSKMYVDELCVGLNSSAFPKITLYDNLTNYKEEISVEDIEFKSICEHHFLPFFGKAKIIYIPNKKIIGLSKINRVVDFISRKPSLQEGLTVEIHNALVNILETEDVAVYLEAKHMCVNLRGIEHNSVVKTKRCTGVLMSKIK